MRRASAAMAGPGGKERAGACLRTTPEGAGRMTAALGGLALLALAGCAAETGTVAGPAPDSAAASASSAPAPDNASGVAQETTKGATPPASPATPALPAPGSRSQQVITSASVPHIYMAIQPGGSGPHSVVFAIDRGRDNSPSDDPAIRLTPDNGKCNPQEMRRFSFPEAYARRPVFGPEESRRGIGAREMPNFMAMAVTSEMMRLGLVVAPPESQPQNVCTRKLWEQLILAQSAPVEN